MEQNIVSKFKLVPHSSRPTFIRSHRKKQIEDDYNKLVERIRTAKHERTREAKEEGLFQMEMIMITLGYDFKEDE